MENTKIVLNENYTGELQLFSNGQKAGLMEIAITGDVLTVYHTEVDEAYNGRGFAKLLLNDLVEYARKQHLKIQPLCAFVHAQFKRHPEQYADVWYQNDN